MADPRTAPPRPPARRPARTGWAFLDEAAERWPVLAFAHRGGAFHPEVLGLENTLHAFRHAVALGFEALETDVHVTADGVLLAFHDAVLDRVTDRTGPVAEASYDEVRAALVGDRERVPALVELLDAFPHARFNVDLKSARAVDALAALVEARGLHDRLLVGSFSARRLRRFRRLTKGAVATGAHPLEIVLWRVLPSGRLARALTSAAALQVPHRRGPVRVTTPGLVRRAHGAGVPVHVWTIDDPDEMRELLDLGVAGIMTDRTDLLRSVLEERGLWPTTAPGGTP